jgi:hypothetical protein
MKLRCVLILERMLMLQPHEHENIQLCLLIQTVGNQLYGRVGYVTLPSSVLRCARKWEHSLPRVGGIKAVA